MKGLLRVFAFENSVDLQLIVSSPVVEDKETAKRQGGDICAPGYLSGRRVQPTLESTVEVMSCLVDSEIWGCSGGLSCQGRRNGKRGRTGQR